MKLTINLNDNYGLEQFILLLNIGLLTSIKSKAIYIDIAEQLLYNPFSIQQLNKLNADKPVIELLLLTSELDDISVLLPKDLENELSKLLQASIDLIHNKYTCTDKIKKWLSNNF